MDEYISREAVFQVVHGIARGIADGDIEALKAKDMRALYKAKGAKEILDSVDTDLCYIPVADVQPVKHGYWKEEEPRVLKCSVCGEYAPMNYLGQNCIDSRYCPWCGTKMDTEPDEPWQSD